MGRRREHMNKANNLYNGERAFRSVGGCSVRRHSLSSAAAGLSFRPGMDVPEPQNENSGTARH